MQREWKRSTQMDPGVLVLVGCITNNPKLLAYSNHNFIISRDFVGQESGLGLGGWVSCPAWHQLVTWWGWIQLAGGLIGRIYDSFIQGSGALEGMAS